MRNRVAALFLATLALTACEAGQGAGLGTIKGHVKRGPTSPVCRVDVPCDGDFAGAKVAIRGAGGTTVRAVSDGKGLFSADVPAGTYEIGVEVEGFLPRCVTAKATVHAGETTTVEVDCDTGIR